MDALAELYDRYGALAYTVALRVLGDPGRSEDVVQEAFLKVWAASPGFDAAKGSLRTWMMTAVRNRAIDQLRGRTGHAREELELPAEGPSVPRAPDLWSAVAASMERDAIQAGLRALPREQRQVIELAYFGGYTGQEIAEMTRVPVSTIKGRMRLALDKLHSFLQGKGLEPSV
ncbi:MAG: RNA polymerase sigma factor [Candidatus Dormibacteraceae bacterium]